MLRFNGKSRFLLKFFGWLCFFKTYVSHCPCFCSNDVVGRLCCLGIESRAGLTSSYIVLGTNVRMTISVLFMCVCVCIGVGVRVCG